MFKKYKILLLMIAAINLIFSSSFAVTKSYGDEALQYALYYKNRIISNGSAYEIDNTLYVSADIIGSTLSNPGITVDKTNGRLNIDLTKENIVLEDPDVTKFVKSYASIVYVPLKKIGGGYYFPLDVVKGFFKVRYSMQKNGVYLYDNTGKVKVARINSDAAKAKPSLADERSESLVLRQNDAVQILKETDNYYKVSLDDGVVCYVKKEYVDIVETDLSFVDFYSTKKRKLEPGKTKISLLWEYVNKETPAALDSKNDAIDILSPVWFSLNDASGNVANKGDKTYADLTHKSGYKVWGMITNNFNSSYISAVLNDDALMKKTAAQLLFYASLYDLDGINIDFENVNDSDSRGLVKFTALMRQYTEKQGINLSIDVMIPKPWTIEYDRDELAKYVDYMAVMTYDEHWSTSAEAGSVASLPWVEEAVKATLAEVPHEKVLLGIPLYTRIWYETVTEGQIKVTSSAVGMETVRNLVMQKGLSVTWLNNEKQYYVQYRDGDKLCKIWIEDSRSIANKLNLVRKYDLAGSAGWRRGFEEYDVWEVFYGMLKEGRSLQAYENNY